MSEGINLLTAIAEHGSSVTLRLLEDEYFVDDLELAMFRSMNNHVRRYGRVPDPATVEEVLNTRLPVTPESVDYYLDRVHKRFVYNQVRDRFGPLRNALQNTDVEALVVEADAIRAACKPIRGQQQDIVNMAEYRGQILAEYRKLHQANGTPGVPFGSVQLNEETGGAYNGDLIMYVARPGVGKTWALIHNAITAKESGRSVLFITMEMTQMQIAMRIAAYLAGLDPDLVRKGRLSYYGERLLRQALDNVESWNDFNIYAGNFDKRTSDIANVIREYNPDVVYVDGVYLMKPSSVNLAKVNRFERVAYCLDELRTITLSIDRPVIGTTQFNRGGAKETTLETVGYTDAIATHSTMVLALKLGIVVPKIIRQQHQDTEQRLESDRAGTNDVYPIQSVKHLSYHRVLELLKNREGLVGISFHSRMRFAPTDFTDCTEAEATGVEAAGEPNLEYMNTGVR